MLHPDKEHTPAWAERLDQLERLPGEWAFSKSAAWSKLETKLQATTNKPSRFPFLLLAAASVLTVIALGVVLHVNRPAETGKRIAYEGLSLRTPLPTATPPVTVVPTAAVISRPMPSLRAKSTRAIKPSAHPMPLAIQTFISPHAVTADSNHSLSAHLIAPKKLTVVHINELANPNQLLEIKSQSLRKQSTMAGGSGKSDLLKIKLSSSN